MGLRSNGGLHKGKRLLYDVTRPMEPRRNGAGRHACSSSDPVLGICHTGVLG